MRKKRSKKSSRYWVVIAILSVVIAGLIFASAKIGLFAVGKIETTMEGTPCVDEANLKNASNLLGKNIFQVNLKEIAQNLKNKFYCIKKVDISYDLFSKVKIYAVGRQPAAALKEMADLPSSSSADLEAVAKSDIVVATPSAQNKNEIFLIDDEGVIFSKITDNLSLPMLFIRDKNLAIGERPEGINIEDIIKILDKVKIFGLDTKKNMVLGNYLIVISDPRIIFKVDEKIEIQLASLQLILTEAKINSRKLEFIDLRFDKPIVRFAPKKNG